MASVDRQDAARLSEHLQQLLDAIRRAPGQMLTNHEVRKIAGSRGMGRVNDLQQAGYRLQVRKQDKSTWLVRYLGDDGQLALL